MTYRVEPGQLYLIRIFTMKRDYTQIYGRGVALPVSLNRFSPGKYVVTQNAGFLTHESEWVHPDTDGKRFIIRNNMVFDTPAEAKEAWTWTCLQK